MVFIYWLILRRATVTSGEYASRDMLPSIKTLVQDSGLSVGTVRHVIDVLVAEGLAYTVSGRGAFVR